MTTHAKGMGLAVMALLLMGGFLAAFPAKADNVQTQVTESSGPTDMLDGGDHRFVRFGADAAFGVVWGTVAHPNYVYLVALKAQYLGVVDVSTVAGAKVRDDVPLRVYTLYAVKLESLLEFQDVNHDGIANFERRVALDGRNFTSYIESEPLYKRVSLKTAWTPSEMIKTEDAATGRRTYEFSLTATNLSYEPLPNATVVSGVLDAVTFTFHLDVGVRHVDNHTVPQYAVTVARGPRGGLVFTNATRAGETTWSGDVLTYKLKWDQAISGWDFDAANTADPGVFLEMQALLVHRIPADREEWFDAAVIGRLNEGGSLQYSDGTTNRTMRGLEGTYSTPKRIVGGNIALGGSWERVGRLTWVSNATVDGNPGVVYAQVLGGIPLLFRSENALWFGFGVLIGLSFPGGAEILHDPVQESDAFVIAPATTSPRVPVGLVLLLVLAAVGVVGAIVALQRKDKGKRLQEAYRQEPPANGQPQDWTKYYQR